ncbi:hypothetical protein BGY98DRAFT_940011 [Russula aff. rugulosa BPL654]|nr:hypothetical protein BGY98DRAFT_940011 [Russula aff. rugulosa BPL654]
MANNNTTKSSDLHEDPASTSGRVATIPPSTFYGTQNQPPPLPNRPAAPSGLCFNGSLYDTAVQKVPFSQNKSEEMQWWNTQVCSNNACPGHGILSSVLVDSLHHPEHMLFSVIVTPDFKPSTPPAPTQPQHLSAFLPIPDLSDHSAMTPNDKDRRLAVERATPAPPIVVVSPDNSDQSSAGYGSPASPDRLSSLVQTQTFPCYDVNLAHSARMVYCGGVPMDFGVSPTYKFLLRRSYI